MQSQEVTTFVPKSGMKLIPIIILVAVLGGILFGVSKLNGQPTLQPTPVLSLEEEYEQKMDVVTDEYTANEREIADMDRKLAELRMKKTDLYNRARGVAFAYCDKDLDRKKRTVDAGKVEPVICADDWLTRNGIVPFIAAAQ